MRHAIVIAAVAGLVWTCPVHAQDAEAARRLALAERYVDLSMGTGLGKLLEDAVEQELEAVDGLSQTERDWMQANVPIILRRHVDAMVDDMAPAYAARLTLEELEALVAFRETPLGRSIAQKELEISVDQGERLTEFAENYTADYYAKFCAAFNCDGPGTGATSGKRNP